MLKRISNILLCFILITANFVFVSCETVDVEVPNNPNALNPDQADPDFFLNSIQVQFAEIHSGEENNAEYGFSHLGMVPVRMLNSGTGPDYRNLFSPSNLNRVWRNTYAGALIDIRTMNEIAEPAELYTHVGIGQIFEAYLIMTLVDFFGDVPYSEALLGADNLNPALDSGASVYEAANRLLDEAIVNLNRQEIRLPSNDLYYGGDEEKWVRLANTIRLKMFLQTRLANETTFNQAASITAINDLVAQGDLILNPEDDFEFQWGTTIAAPDSRHPFFARNFDGAGPSAAFYMNNYYMNLLANQYSNIDPRIRYYMYRQQSDFSEANFQTKECVTFETPAWWPADEPFCIPPATNGYDGLWGRDHGNNDGIPPDDQFRTVFGVYPVGGPFDNDSFRNVATTQALSEGLLGAGISPILLSSFTNFMLAEASLTLGTTGDARTYLETGIRQSFEKVINFGASLANQTPEFVPDSSTIDAHVNEILEAYDNADEQGKLKVVVEQYFIALWGNGIEAYNTYRRTGQPNDLPPTSLIENPGVFVRSMWYSQRNSDANSSYSQKAAPSSPVFWDTNPENFVD